MGKLFKFEIRKITRQKSFYICFGISLLILVLSAVIMKIAANDAGSDAVFSPVSFTMSAITSSSYVKGVCHHHGYINYRAMMKKIKEFVPNPEQVMVTGYSAGGFASELLTDDVMSIYDKCDNFVCLADSGIACNDWHSVAVNEWGAPKEICDRLKTDNLALDCLLDLHRKHGNRVKVMLGCTYRDALLAQEQLYCDGHPFDFTKEAGDRFQAILKDTVETLINEIPDVSIYIFDRKNAEVTVGELTDHTFIATDTVFDYFKKQAFWCRWRSLSF